MAYDLPGIDPGRLYATYFVGDRVAGSRGRREGPGVLVEAPAVGRDHRLPREGQLLRGEGVSFSFDLARRRRTSPRLRFCFWGGRSAFRASIVPRRWQWRLQLWWVALAVEVAVVVVVMGVGCSSGIGEGEGSGGDEANSGDSVGGGP